MEELTRDKNPDSTDLYKILTHCLIEHYKKRPREPQTAEFLLENFITLFQEQNVPVSSLLESFIDVLGNKIMKNDKVNGYITTAEFQFIDYVVKHETFSIEIGLKLLEILSFVFLNKPFLSKAVTEPILKLISKFKEESSVSEIVLKTIVP